jgi:hypothetical protein
VPETKAVAGSRQEMAILHPQASRPTKWAMRYKFCYRAGSMTEWIELSGLCIELRVDDRATVHPFHDAPRFADFAIDAGELTPHPTHCKPKTNACCYAQHNYLRYHFSFPAYTTLFNTTYNATPNMRPLEHFPI